MKFGLPQEAVFRINGVFASFPEVEEVILYGSRAKGTQRPASDIDITLKGYRLDLGVLNKMNAKLDDLLLPYMFDLSIYDQLKNEELLAHIQRVGKIFYTKSK